MKALVIGATGIIGNHVVRSLLSEGIAVRAFSRGVTPQLNLADLDVERCCGDMNDQVSLTQAMRGCDWVFHTASYYPTHTFDIKGHTRRAMHGIRSVIAAAKDAQVERLVYTSSLTTVGPPHEPGQLADETCGYQNVEGPPHPYFLVKYLMEQEIQKEACQGAPFVTVLPTGCFGPYELKPPQLCLVPQLIKRKLPAYVLRPINVVDVADVGRGHILAAQKGKIGERYILGGHNVDSRWIIAKICAVGGVRPPALRVPLTLALLPAWLAEGVGHFILKDIPKISILGLRFIEHGQHLSSKKAQNQLGYTISPMEPCFERAIQWFKKINYC